MHYPQTMHVLYITDRSGRLLRAITAPAVERLRQAQADAERAGNRTQIVRYAAVAVSGDAMDSAA